MAIQAGKKSTIPSNCTATGNKQQKKKGTTKTRILFGEWNIAEKSPNWVQKNGQRAGENPFVNINEMRPQFQVWRRRLSLSLPVATLKV